MNRSDLMARLRQLARASQGDGETVTDAPGNESRRRFTQGVLGAAAGAWPNASSISQAPTRCATTTR